MGITTFPCIREETACIWTGILGPKACGASRNFNQTTRARQGGHQVRSGGDLNKLRANVQS